jgi:hypothetical protein
MHSTQNGIGTTRSSANPNSVQALVGYGQLLTGAKLLNEAERYIRRAIAQKSEFFWPSVLEANLLSVVLARGDHDEYIRLAAATLEALPDLKPTLNGIIGALGYRGRNHEAEMYLERLQNHDPVWAFNARMLLMAVRGDTPLGSAGLKANLEHPLASNISRGETCFILGDVECGVRYWRRIESTWLPALWWANPSMEVRWASNIVRDPRYQALLEELGIGKTWRTYMRTHAEALASVTGIEVTTAPPPEDVPAI